MAVIKSGILGKASGKIGGIVAATWKNKNYVRTLVTPANPNTPAQQAARAKFKNCGATLAGIVGNILNPYMSPFLRAMSGFNWAVKTNLANWGAPPEWADIKISHGQLFGATIISTSITSGALSVTTSTTLGTNGLSTDVTYLAVFNVASGQWAFAPAEVARSVGTITATVTGAAGNQLAIFVVTARRDGANRVTMVSDSAVTTTTWA